VVLKRWIVRALFAALTVACLLVPFDKVPFDGGSVAVAGELQRRIVASTALKRDMTYSVYVPDGYRSSGLQYPVLYLLHGAGGDENGWVEHGDLLKRADRLIASGAIPPSLIVMPGCHACWWVDGAKDLAETAFWTDLVPAVAQGYRTIETRAGRLVAGLSAGGYGAVRFGMKYPDQIGAVAALSPAVYAVTPPAHSSARKQPPFLNASGEFDQSLWTALNYTNLTERYFGQTHRVPFYLMSGDRDGFGIAFETAALFKVMFDRQPELAKLRIVDGDHNWQVWSNALDDSMTYLFGFATRPYKAQPTAPNVAAQAAPALAMMAAQPRR
jgi:enterochelin esterase-like enzyme